MNADYTDLTIVLDRSGSMSSIRQDTIGGFNTFLEEQQAAPGKLHITLYQFDHAYEQVYSLPGNEVKPLDQATFVPRGSTALRDAMGRAIVETGERLAAMDEADRPGKVIMLILTDGFENASREYSQQQIAAMITHQKEKYNWDFVFLGANQDAILTASQYGINTNRAASYGANSLTSYRSADVEKGGTMDFFSDEDRKEMMGESTFTIGNGLSFYPGVNTSATQAEEIEEDENKEAE